MGKMVSLEKKMNNKKKAPAPKKKKLRAAAGLFQLLPIHKTPDQIKLGTAQTIIMFKF